MASVSSAVSSTRSSRPGDRRPPRSPVPLLLQFGTEVNGFWFQWSGKWAGGGADDGLRRPRLPRWPRALQGRLPPHPRCDHRPGRRQHHVVLARDRGEQPERHPGTRSRTTTRATQYVDWMGLSNYGPIFLRRGAGSGRGFALDDGPCLPAARCALSKATRSPSSSTPCRQDKKKAAWTRSRGQRGRERKVAPSEGARRTGTSATATRTGPSRTSM